MSRRLAVALLAPALLLGAACSGGKAHYTSATAGMFAAGCNPTHDASLDATCRCAYERVQQRYTYDQFVELDKQLMAEPNKIPDTVMAIFTACSVEASDSPGSSGSSS